ncbi:MAG: VOC family protein [Myxococcales bacterium]|nr:VOC family protein [Myxococcales bacterium]
MKRVTGIGGVFFKSKDPKALSAWYHKHLGIPLESWGGAVFRWQSPDNPSGVGSTVWSPFAETTSYFGGGDSQFMLNFRVHDLRALLTQLREEGCSVDDKIDESELGLFGWITDPEGRRIELWQPPEGR